MATPKLTILLSGMIAGVPHQGGATWAVLQYLLGFKRLGHNVHFVEPVEEAALRPAGVPLARWMPPPTSSAQELRVLCDPRVRATLAAEEIELCSFTSEALRSLDPAS
jgi:hypothetical protein